MATFTNQATLTFRGVTASSNTVTGEIVGVLSAEKTALAESYSLGTGITYIISLRNAGETALTNITILDDLGTAGEANAPLDYVQGSAVWFLDGVRQPSISVSTDNGLSFTGVTVPANGNSLIIYDAVTNAYAPLAVGSEITNTASVTGGITPIDVSETVPVSAEPVLSISKALSPLTVTENGELTYTFVIENTGNMAAEQEDGVILSDVFDPVLNGLTASLNGAALTLGEDYTYNAVTGEFSTVTGVITVPAATYSQDPSEKTVTVPGRAVLTVTGTI